MASKGAKKVRHSAGDSVRELSEAEKKLDRAEELSTNKDVFDAALDIFNDVEMGFTKQADRSDNNMDWWDVYNCTLGNRQYYQGTSQIFVPITYNAVNARKTRFVNQLFPITGRFVEVTTEDGEIPYSEMALLEHYVRSCKIRTRVAPALIKNGDVEGQMTIQVGWMDHKRHTVAKVKKPAKLDLEEDIDGDEDDDIEDIIEQVVHHAGPTVDVIADNDLLVLPFTANSIEDALSSGGSVTTICRWSSATIKKKIAEKVISKEAGDSLLEEMKLDPDKSPQQADKQRKMVDAAGIHGDGRGKYAVVYRTWTMLTIDDERRLCLCYFGGGDKVLSVKRNPYWCDRCDIISAPADKVDGSFKGKSRVEVVSELQYQANDACNEGMDSAAYALLPIVMTDPEKNPKTGQMVLSMAAIWETSPSDTQFAKFPELWKDALEIVANVQSQIFQTLSVNPAQITQANNPKSKKPSQAEIANEQQVDILTTADAIIPVEEEILSPMLLLMLELDHQYRSHKVHVRQYGETGMKQNMQEIPPTQMNKLYQFRWFGVEAARNAQMLQQQISFINVVKGIPPALYKRYRVDLGPLLSMQVETMFGPRLAPLTLIDTTKEQSVEPDMENQLLGYGFSVPVHPLDNHQQHIQIHGQLAQQNGDPTGKIREHITWHLMEMKQAQAQQSAAQPPPGARGGPRQGATPQAPRGGQNPAGAIHQDRMRDPTMMPRQ